MATEHVNGPASGRNGAHLDFKIIGKAALSQADILLPQGHSKNPAGDKGDDLGAILPEVFARLGHRHSTGTNEI